MKFLISLVMLFQSIFEGNEIVNEVEKVDAMLNEVEIPIVMYHHIEPDESLLNDFIVTQNKLEEDLKKIRSLGYNTISYEELHDFVNNGTHLPEKPIIITFDDGYESNYKYLYPLLKKYNMKATIAIIGNMVGKDMYDNKSTYKHFSYDEAKEMYNSGLVEIQTHTYNLHNINERIGVRMKEGEEEETYKKLFYEDIETAKRELEENVGNKSFVFTYPYGAYDELTEAILKELGFEITVTTDSGTNIIKRGDQESLLKLKRYNITNSTDIAELLKWELTSKIT